MARQQVERTGYDILRKVKESNRKRSQSSQKPKFFSTKKKKSKNIKNLKSKSKKKPPKKERSTSKKQKVNPFPKQVHNNDMLRKKFAAIEEARKRRIHNSLKLHLASHHTHVQGKDIDPEDCDACCNQNFSDMVSFRSIKNETPFLSSNYS